MTTIQWIGISPDNSRFATQLGKIPDSPPSIYLLNGTVDNLLPVNANDSNYP